MAIICLFANLLRLAAGSRTNQKGSQIVETFKYIKAKIRRGRMDNDTQLSINFWLSIELQQIELSRCRNP